jgi:hypothetical protein
VVLDRSLYLAYPVSYGEIWWIVCDSDSHSHTGHVLSGQRNEVRLQERRDSIRSECGDLGLGFSLFLYLPDIISRSINSRR